VIEQVVVPGDAAEHGAHPMRGFLFPADSRRRGSGHAATASRRAASMLASTRPCSTPDTMATSPIVTGKTK